MSERPSLRVAVLGAGTVGGPVVRALLSRPEKLAPFDGLLLTLAGVADRFIDRVIAGGVPADLVTDAPAHLVADPDVDVIVELMGGDEPARTLIAAALAAGKAVVTANKHVLAHHGPQLEAIAREHGGTLRFEAAVGGGTPVLTPLAEGLAADDILQVRGIVNGTTNFILTSMREQGSAYRDALAEAQARGYAEADPRGDVEGDDAVNKAVILARLAVGAWLAPADVPVIPQTLHGGGLPGVTGVTAGEIAAAGALGLTLKLIALVEIGPDGRPAASVLPSAVDRASPLGRTDGVLNRIEVVADPVGTVAFSGPGAGGDATSSAVLGDLVALARGQGSTWAGLPPAAALRPLQADAPAAGRRRPGAAAPAAPLAGPGAWFAFLPGVAAATVRAASGAGVAESAEIAGGTAVRTTSLALAAARAALAAPTALAAAAGAADATLYRVVE
jgi:homoserine dehydrogenase